MRLFWHCSLGLLALMVSLAQATPAPVAMSTADSAAVRGGVRAFMDTVAHDVSQKGPLAWGRYFEDSPAFFMAVDGQMIFSSGAVARDGLPKVALTYRHIELHWGNDVRIDPLTPWLAVVAVSWRETLTDSAGHVMKQAGFFTGIAEYRNGRWQFRDVHWSAPVSSLPVR